jgi:hypothetical protein
MRSYERQAKSDTAEKARLAIQGVPIVIMVILLEDRASRLVRDLNRCNRYIGRG